MTPKGLVLVKSSNGQWWRKTFRELLPEVQVVLLEEEGYDPASVAYAVVWDPPIGMFARFPNLQCVVSIGAGVSHILKDKDYPQNVPIIRTIGKPLQTKMAEYVVLHVLRFHRRLDDVMQAYREKNWTQYQTPLASEVTVGVMGLGNLGAVAAKTLSDLRFRVVGWSRRGRSIEGVEVYKGKAQLREFLSSVSILVSILPQTPATENVLCKEVFEMIPDGAFLINIGRGENLVESDLLTALNSGKLAGATLDVFREEPLSVDDPLWAHPKVLITCHTAAAIDPKVGGEIIASNLRKFIMGQEVPDIVDIEQGY